MDYCNKCVMPNTKPDLHIGEDGVCNACRSYEKRKEIDWESRRQELIRVLEKYRSKDGKRWDCIVPVSGGKTAPTRSCGRCSSGRTLSV